jgi:hypothetical protein
MYQAIIVKLAQEHGTAIWSKAGSYAFDYRHTLTASHDDCVGLLQNGNPNSYAKIIDPQLPSQQATIQVLNQLGLNWVSLTLPDTFSFTHWPTEYKYVTQRFGANPENYSEFGLPGHEGVDFKAYTNTKIVAVAPGIISDLHPTPTGHNYGIFVRVKHTDNWETTYAHLASTQVTLGASVTGGQVLGLADSTGNSNGSHLHLTLKNKVQIYTDPNGVTWPYNIWDPTPYLTHFEGVYWPPLPPTGNSNPAVGLHLRADPDRCLSGEWAEVTTLQGAATPNIIKLLHAHPDPNFIDAATKLGGSAKYIIRIFQSGWDDRTITPTDFVNWNVAELGAKIGILNSYGVPYENIYVEIHNEPNLVQEGWNTFNWVNGTAFGHWLSEVIMKLDLRLPAGVKLMYPGLSPGGAINDVRYDTKSFMQESKSTLTNLDGLGVHAYWEASQNNMQAALDWINWNHNLTTKPIFVTEASIVDRPSVITPVQQGQSYASFIKGLRGVNGVAGITFFVGSASNPYFEPEVWVTSSNQIKGIANALVGAL